MTNADNTKKCFAQMLADDQGFRAHVDAKIAAYKLPITNKELADWVKRRSEPDYKEEYDDDMNRLKAAFNFGSR